MNDETIPAKAPRDDCDFVVLDDTDLKPAPPSAVRDEHRRRFGAEYRRLLAEQREPRNGSTDKA